MACPRTCVVVRSFTTGAIIKDGHARIVIHAPGDHSPLGPDTFSQIASRPTQFFLHSSSGPYMLRQRSHFLGPDPHSHLTCHLVWQRRVRGIAMLDASKGCFSTCPENV